MFLGEHQDFLISTSANGWQTSNTFQQYVIKLVEEMRQNGIEGPIVLFADGFPGHFPIELRKYCNDHDVIFIILLPNSTHLLQPLDVVVFKTVKTEFKNQCSIYKRIEKKTELTEVDFIKIVSRTLKKAITVELVKKSFLTTGLFPLNPVYQHQGRIIAPSIPPVDVDPIPSILSETPLSSQAVLNRVMEIERELNVLKSIQRMSTPQNPPVVSPASENTAIASLNLSAVASELFLTPQSQPNSIASSSHVPAPLNDILTIPQVPVKSRKRQFKVKSCGVISSTTVINAFEEQQKAKEAEKDEADARKKARIEKKEITLKIKEENAKKREQIKIQKQQELLKKVKKRK